MGAAQAPAARRAMAAASRSPRAKGGALAGAAASWTTRFRSELDELAAISPGASQANRVAPAGRLLAFRFGRFPRRDWVRIGHISRPRICCSQMRNLLLF